MYFEEVKECSKKYLVYFLGVYEIWNILRVIFILNYVWVFLILEVIKCFGRC